MVTVWCHGQFVKDIKARDIEWQDEGSKAAVALFHFQLMQSGKLCQATVRELKRPYGLEQDEDSS